MLLLSVLERMKWLCMVMLSILSHFHCPELLLNFIFLFWEQKQSLILTSFIPYYLWTIYFLYARDENDLVPLPNSCPPDSFQNNGTEFDDVLCGEAV